MEALAISRLKREQFNRTKHDSSFSDWKILIGPCDWEDHSKGKEGCSRYRIHNLPQPSAPGVYELGIAACASVSGRQIYKLAPDCIVAVYLGQAEKVRARLQHYGRTGAHLDDSSLSLFHQVFSQGFSILYRWAPMQNKEDALRTETRLLSTFDYAWNTSNNGIRRPDDILQKLHQIASGTRKHSGMARALPPFTPKQVGIQIKSIKLDEADNGRYNFLSRVFSFNRSRPRLVQDSAGTIQEQENAKICGVALGDGSICRKPPAEKRMRCPEHIGVRTNVSTAKAIRAPKSETESSVVLETNVYCQTKGNGYRDQNFRHDLEDPSQTVLVFGSSPVDKSITNTDVCGIILNDGSTCRRQPVKGRKRCHEHKGRIIHASIQTMGNGYRYQNVGSSPVYESITNTNICGFILNDGSTCTRHPVEGRKRCHEHKGRIIHASIQTMGNGYRYQNVGSSPVYESITNTNICGIILNDGSTCTRHPVEGRKRCHEHKGMRIHASIQTMGNGYRYQTVGSSPVYERITNTNICGIILNDGSTCTRHPVEGRQRCHEHKGRRINASIQTMGNGYRYQTVVSSPVYESITNTNICGIILNDGSPCTRHPVDGRQRCHEHKGRRIRTSFI